MMVYDRHSPSMARNEKWWEIVFCEGDLLGNAHEKILSNACITKAQENILKQISNLNFE